MKNGAFKFVDNTAKAISVGEGRVIKREWGLSPNGNPFNGCWVLREEATGKYIDHDVYSNDLAERNDFNIINEKIN